MQNSQENLALCCISGVSLGAFWAWGLAIFFFFLIFNFYYYFKDLLSNNVQTHHIHTPKREREKAAKKCRLGSLASWTSLHFEDLREIIV